MRRSLPFVAIAILIVSSGVLLCWPFLGDEGRSALTAAALLVALTQIPLHVLLDGWRRSNDHFLAAMLIGFASRLGVIVAGIVFFVVPGKVEPLVFLLGLAGFLVAVLFAESILEQRHGRPPAEVRANAT